MDSDSEFPAYLTIDESTEARRSSQDTQAPSSSLRTPPAVDYTNLVDPSQTKAKSLRREPSAFTDCHRVLTKTFGHQDYKGKQREIVEAAVHGADIFVLAPTGMGKSLCFQVPAIAEQHGITIVVSPLLALMKDQVYGLREKGVDVVSLTSETSHSDKKEITRDLSSGHPVNRLLYITPEKLCNSDFLHLLTNVYENKELNRLVIDEAHCISEWGHDFRAEYRRLGVFRKKFEDIPIMALTATATPGVQQDIIRSLGMSEDHLVKVIHPFNRANLYYEVQYMSLPNPAIQMAAIADYIFTLYERRQRPSSGIVYCRTRAGCDDLSGYLRGRGINSRPYHRGIKSATLDKTLKDWSCGGDGTSGVDVVCATIAFGLGIDKGDVRYIIHYDLPKSLEGYYQETGRAGRDGSPSKCVLFYSREDVVRVRRWVISAHSKRVTVSRADGPEPSQRALDSLSSLVAFAESTEICRHVAICRYFGEPIDITDKDTVRKYCNKMCDICKYPEKTKEKHEKLSSEEFAATQVPAYNPREADDGRDEEFRAGPSRANSNARGQDDTWRRDFRDRPVQGNNFKRSRPEDDNNPIAGPSRSKKSKSGTSYPGGSLVIRQHASVSTLKKPFKTPFLAPASAAKSTLDVIDLEDSEEEGQGHVHEPAMSPKILEEEKSVEVDGVELESAHNTRSSSPVDLSEPEGTLEASYSQKINPALRHEALANIRKALHKGFLRGSGVEQMWEQLGAAQADAEARPALLDDAAHKLEFIAFSMCSTADGYASRAEEAVNAVRFLGKNHSGWDKSGKEDEWEDALEALATLKEVCGGS